MMILVCVCVVLILNQIFRFTQFFYSEWDVKGPRPGEPLSRPRARTMLIKEYRIPLPLTVEEYRIAQLYMIAVS